MAAVTICSDFGAQGNKDCHCFHCFPIATKWWDIYSLQGKLWPRRSNQSILKEISPGCSLEGLMLMLKLQYFGHLMQRTDSLEKTLMLGRRLKAGGEGDNRGWDGWMASPTQWTWVWVNSRNWRWTGRPGMLQSMGSQRVSHTEWLNWGITMSILNIWIFGLNSTYFT